MNSEIFNSDSAYKLRDNICDKGTLLLRSHRFCTESRTGVIYGEKLYLYTKKKWKSYKQRVIENR